MCLRFSATLIIGTALAVSSLANAKTPLKPSFAPAKVSAPSSVSASGLAQVQAIVSYCELVDRHSAAKYRQLGSLVLSGYSPAEIGSDQRTSAYLAALGEIDAALARIPVSAGISACETAIAGL
jgi:hypothetical protein